MTPFSSSKGVCLVLSSEELLLGSRMSSFGEEGFSAGGISWGLLGRSVGFCNL